MSTQAITIKFDLEALPAYTDTFVAQLWHVAQANPVDIRDRDAGDIAERIAREIVRRWLSQTPVELWAHQGRHAVQCELTDARNELSVRGARHV